MSELNVREERFCLAVANTGDKYKAFDIANYEAKTQGAKAASVSRLLKRPEIKARIAEATDELMLAKGVTEDRITANLAEIAFDKDNCKADRNRALEILARKLGLLTDNINSTDTQRQRELDAQEAVEASELARLRLAAKYGLIADKQPEGQVEAEKADVKAG